MRAGVFESMDAFACAHHDDLHGVPFERMGCIKRQGLNRDFRAWHTSCAASPDQVRKENGKEVR